MGGDIGGPAYNTLETKQERLDFLRSRNNWSSTAPKAAGGRAGDLLSERDPPNDTPLKRILDPLYERLYDFRVDEKT